MTEAQFTIGLVLITFFVGALVEIIAISWLIGWFAARWWMFKYLVLVWLWLMLISFHVHTEIPADIWHLNEWYW